MQNQTNKFMEPTPDATSDAESVIVSDDSRRTVGYGLLIARMFEGVLRFPQDAKEVSGIVEYLLKDDRYAHSGDTDVSSSYHYYHVAKLLFCRRMGDSSRIF
jgi:hypothetical protein